MSLKSFLLVLAIATTAYGQNFDFTAYRGCVRRLFDDICTNNLAFYEGLVQTLASCGAPVSANTELVSNYCARDEEAGIYCGTAESYPALLGATLAACFTTIAGGSCTDDCRNSLMTIRSELGCCVNAFYNNTLYAELFGAVLSYSLWSSCGVEQPNRTCDGALPYTLPATPTRTCTREEIEACRENDMAVIQNAAPAGCEAIISYNMARCSARSDGLCITDVGTDIEATGPIASITTNCATAAATQSCSSSCETSLQNFVDNRGCCVNTLYNSTFSTVTALNALIPTFQNTVLFDVCGIEPPPLTCTDGSLSLKSVGLMMLLPLIVTALLGNKI